MKTNQIDHTRHYVTVDHEKTLPVIILSIWEHVWVAYTNTSSPVEIKINLN